MSIYTSQGKISLDWDQAETKNANEMAVFFVPDGDHSIKQGSETFAVFAPLSRCDDKAILRVYDTDKGVKVKLPTASDENHTKGHEFRALMEIVSYAATHQTNVRIRVKPPEEQGGIAGIVACAADRLVKAVSAKDNEDKKKSAQETVEKIIQAVTAKKSSDEESLLLVGITVPGRPAK